MAGNRPRSIRAAEGPIRPPFTLDQLVVLDAVSRHGSFAAAAAHLHRVPSAISYTVRGLEDAVGVALFRREGRTVRLNAAGQRVLEAGRRVLEGARGLDHLAAELREDWEPTVHVVIDGALPLTPVTRALQTLMAEGMPTQFRLDVEYQEGVIDRFEADGAQLGLHLGFDPGEDTSALVVHDLPDLPFDLVVARDHALTKRVGPTRADFSDIPEFVVRDSSPRYSRVPKGSYLGSRHVIHVGDFHSKRLALLHGAGFGWIPRHVIDDDLARGDLVPVSFDGRASWIYHPRLFYRVSPPLGRAGQRLLAALLHQHS